MEKKRGRSQSDIAGWLDDALGTGAARKSHRSTPAGATADLGVPCHTTSMAGGSSDMLDKVQDAANNSLDVLSIAPNVVPPQMMSQTPIKQRMSRRQRMLATSVPTTSLSYGSSNLREGVSLNGGTNLVIDPTFTAPPAPSGTVVAKKKTKKRRSSLQHCIMGMPTNFAVAEQGETSGSTNEDVTIGPARVRKPRETPQARRKRKCAQAALGGQPVPTHSTKLSRPTICDKCGATKFMYESKGFCCSDGQVSLASNDCPQKLVDLFTGPSADSVHFRTYARLYNNLFAFTSLGGSFDVMSDQGIYVFKAHGQIYHFVPNLLPHDDKPRYLQLYFYDADHEKNNRLGFFPELLPSVVDILMDVMKDNPYACFFKSLSELNVTENTRIALKNSPNLDQRVYNAPTADEVAAVWLDSSTSDGSSGPHIVVYGKAEKTHRIMHYYGCYDPLQYPLLYPRGDCGWHPGMSRISRDGTSQPVESQTTHVATVLHDAEELLAREEAAASARPGKRGKNISCREYYNYKLQIRPHNHLLNCGRLYQQYLVDMYVKLENTRLDFYRRYQDVIRADLYQGIVDTVVQGEYDAANIGYRVILPPSFIGGPRDMRRRYLNSMTLVQKYGKPDLFLTMTCNGNWPEIKEQLRKGDHNQNRPDLVARIFRAKLIALKKEIMENHVFGEVAALIYVIEFQKRGFPHAHFLIILKPGHKIQNPEVFDNYTCAEIPSYDNPHLRAAVIKHMMHGPCGSLNPKCACMKLDGHTKKCKASYPKPFAEYTTTGDDCYPVYKRRDTGETVSVRKANLDNRWVVPYNPYLLAKFDCHMNVEICSTIKAVKYLYKYVYKGHDRVSFSIVQETGKGPVDEIENYQAGRWVSPPEAAWRIFGFDLFEIYPPVTPLPIHTNNMHLVRFRGNENIKNVLNDVSVSKTMLTEFFTKNAQRGPNVRKYFYSEYPEHFTWDAQGKLWKDRKRGFVVGRLASAAPGDGERYYLRLLLAKVPGPTSYGDLKKVGGHECATFQDAAYQRGLLESDESVENCMDEAVEFQMPRALRRLFATVLIFCQPSDPKRCWEKYYDALSEDYQLVFPRNELKVLQMTAQKVESYLEGMGKSFRDFNLEYLHDVQDEAVRQTRDIIDALEAHVPEEYINARKELNPQQKTAYKAIVHRVKAGKPGVFFIDGPGGTGKTFLYCALYAKIRSMGKICLPTASSGIAASNMPSGRTAHSRFKIPTDDSGAITCEVSKQSSLASLLQQTTLIIWDEASMAKKENVESLDLLLRDLCESKVPFGGKIVVFGGDFRQVLPVLPRRTQSEAVEASIVSSRLWPMLEKFRLTENVRARDDPCFSAFLLELGNGALQTSGNGFVKLPPTIMMQPSEEAELLPQLSSVIFPELADATFSSDIFNKRAILTPKNVDVDAINSLLIAEFPGEHHTYKSFDSVVDDNCQTYPCEFLNTLCPGGMSPHELALKPECPVILLRNLDPAAGLCNGTRMVCKKFLPNMIECEISAGYYKGERVFLPRITLKPSASSKYPFQFQRKQFPIKLCFAMTINKAQGQTLERVGVYLPHPCFSHGQLYVALSRAKTTVQLKVLVDAATAETKDVNSVKNIVSFEVLKRAGIIEN